jgi:hypothetical protein
LTFTVEVSSGQAARTERFAKPNGQAALPQHLLRAKAQAGLRERSGGIVAMNWSGGGHWIEGWKMP